MVGKRVCQPFTWLGRTHKRVEERLAIAVREDDRWLEGSRDVTVDFRRRVRLAETAFLALCEALLSHDPARGAALWRALRVTMATRYVGAAGIDELLHVVFRAPDSGPVTALREELISLPLCHTDRDLFDVVAAASYNDKAAWILDMAAEDRASPLVWRQRRGVLLEGLGTADTLPVVDAWPEGQMRTDSATSGARLPACAGVKPVRVTGGAPILRPRIQRKPTLRGFCSCGQRTRALGSGCATTWKRRTPVTTSSLLSSHMCSLTGRHSNARWRNASTSATRSSLIMTSWRVSARGERQATPSNEET